MAEDEAEVEAEVESCSKVGPAGGCSNGDVLGAVLWVLDVKRGFSWICSWI